MNIGELAREKALNEIKQEIIEQIRNSQNLWHLADIKLHAEKVLAGGRKSDS